MHDENLPDDGCDAGKIFAVFQFCGEEEIRKRDSLLHKTGQPQELQKTTHGCLLLRKALTWNFGPRDTAPPHNCGSLPPSGILCARFPSLPESSKTTPAARPTRFRAPTRPPHPLRRDGFRRSTEIAFLSSIRRAASPAALPRADLAEGPAPCPAAP